MGLNSPERPCGHSQRASLQPPASASGATFPRLSKARAREDVLARSSASWRSAERGVRMRREIGPADVPSPNNSGTLVDLTRLDSCRTLLVYNILLLHVQ